MGNKAVRAYAIRTFAIDDTQFWQIATPVACATWTLRGAADFLIRTDPDDSTTEDRVTAGTQEGAATTSSTFIHQRYGNNEVVIWAKNAAAGSVVLVGKFFD